MINHYMTESNLLEKEMVLLALIIKTMIEHIDTSSMKIPFVFCAV